MPSLLFLMHGFEVAIVRGLPVLIGCLLQPNARLQPLHCGTLIAVRGSFMHPCQLLVPLRRCVMGLLCTAQRFLGATVCPFYRLPGGALTGGQFGPALLEFLHPPFDLRGSL